MKALDQGQPVTVPAVLPAVPAPSMAAASSPAPPGPPASTIPTVTLPMESSPGKLAFKGPGSKVKAPSKLIAGTAAENSTPKPTRKVAGSDVDDVAEEALDAGSVGQDALGTPPVKPKTLPTPAPTTVATSSTTTTATTPATPATVPKSKGPAGAGLPWLGGNEKKPAADEEDSKSLTQVRAHVVDMHKCVHMFADTST